MLKYFYTGKYNEPIDENKELRLRLQVKVLTYNLADKYDVPALMGLAKERFKSRLSKGATPEEYLSVVSDVYTIPTSTNALRAIAVEYARMKFRDMMQSADLEILRATLQDVPEFAFDVLQLFVNAPLRGHCYFCGPNQSAEALTNSQRNFHASIVSRTNRMFPLSSAISKFGFDNLFATLAKDCATLIVHYIT